MADDPLAPFQPPAPRAGVSSEVPAANVGVWAALLLGSSLILGALGWVGGGASPVGTIPSAAWFVSGALAVTSALALAAVWFVRRASDPPAAPRDGSGQAPWVAITVGILGVVSVAVGAGAYASGGDAQAVHAVLNSTGLQLTVGIVVRGAVGAAVLLVPRRKLAFYSSCITISYLSVALGMQFCVPGIVLGFATALIEVMIVRRERPLSNYVANVTGNLSALALAVGGSATGLVASLIVGFAFQGSAALFDAAAGGLWLCVAREAVGTLPWMVGLHLANRRFVPIEPAAR
jgi:hypothetical protein